MKKTLLISAVLGLLVTGIVTGCQKQSETPASPAPAAPATNAPPMATNAPTMTNTQAQ